MLALKVFDTGILPDPKVTHSYHFVSLALFWVQAEKCCFVLGRNEWSQAVRRRKFEAWAVTLIIPEGLSDDKWHTLRRYSFSVRGREVRAVWQAGRRTGPKCPWQMFVCGQFDPFRTCEIMMHSFTTEVTNQYAELLPMKLQFTLMFGTRIAQSFRQVHQPR